MSCTDIDCFIESSPNLSADGPVALFEQLRNVVERCLAHRRCFFIVEAEPVHRYVQGLVHDDGFVIESVSNTSLGQECAAEHGLTRGDQHLLIRLGWSPPDDDHPNWYRQLDVDVHYPAALATEMLVRTLTEVHRALPRDLTLLVHHAHDPAERVPVDS